jgi:hypothetical protein
MAKRKARLSISQFSFDVTYDVTNNTSLTSKSPGEVDMLINKWRPSTQTLSLTNMTKHALPRQ